MIGNRIVSPPASPNVALLQMALGTTLALLGAFTNKDDLLVAAAAPMSFGLMLLFTRRGRLELELVKDAIEVDYPKPQTIYYDLIDAISFDRDVDPSQSRNFELRVSHRDGMLIIPASIDFPTTELLRFLLSHLTKTSSPVPSSLREHYERQVEQFDSERVHGYRARSHVAKVELRRGWLSALILLVLAIGFLTYDLSMPKREMRGLWTGISSLCFIASFIVFIVMAAKAGAQNKQVTNRRTAAIVISPIGLALVQGELKGKMRWDEITGISWTQKGNAIQVRFDGGSIDIPDIYNANLARIYDQLWANWRPPSPRANFHDDY